MGSLFSLTLIFLTFASVHIITAQDTEISAHYLDLLIRNYSFHSYDKHFKTGSFHSVHLPANFSGIRVESARFRCGSLRRYGAQAKGFHLSTGVTIQPCIERVMLVIQNLGFSWSNKYYTKYYNLSGYHLISPVLGLVAYNIGTDLNSSYPFEVEIHAEEQPIIVNFTSIRKLTSHSTLSKTLCAIFGKDGNITLEKQAAPYICFTKKQGHFGLVAEGPRVETPPPAKRTKKAGLSRWKVAVGSMIGAALGAFLMGLLLVAIFVKVKKEEKSRMEEMERRAYEEEALQVSMVGHVRAHTANGTRTVPTIEHEYSPFGS